MHILSNQKSNVPMSAEFGTRFCNDLNVVTLKMKAVIIAFIVIVFGATSYGQSKDEKEILKEGIVLYKTEMASWYGTDIFLEKFNDKRQNVGGYFSYLSGEKAVCIFFSLDNNPKIVASFIFDSTFSVSSAITDGVEREPTKKEKSLWAIRQSALAEFQRDTLFKTYRDMNPNFIPLDDAKGKRVYVLSGPQKHGTVVFGNDYLLSFDEKNKVKSKRRLHKNIIPIEYAKQGEPTVLTTMHSHLPETGDLITATDICTLMLYEKYAGWNQHIVFSPNNVSLWDCNKNILAVLTRKAWDKIYDNEKGK